MKIKLKMVVIFLLLIIPSLSGCITNENDDKNDNNINPVGRYYHYIYEVKISPYNNQSYTILLPAIILNNSEIADFMDQITNIGYSIQKSHYGEVINISSNKTIFLNAKGSYDAIKNSTDYKSDLNPTFSTWNKSISGEEESFRDLSGDIWIYSNIENINLRIRYEVWYKNWRVNDEYVRGGGGYGLNGEELTKKGWFLFNISTKEIDVE